MPYKTIVLQLLEDRPQLWTRLQQYRQALPTVEFYAQELKTLHEDWKPKLTHSTPGSDPAQIASEAMELALAELQARLPAESATDDETLPLDQAMAFVTQHSSID